MFTLVEGIVNFLHESRKSLSAFATNYLETKFLQ